MKPRFYITIGILFVLAGGLIAYQPLMQSWRQHHQKTVAVAPPKRDAALQAATKSNQVIEGNPVRIVVSSVHIDVPIINGYYNAKTHAWTLSLDKAQYATITTKPNNETGNTFIYGHNRLQVFNRLPQLKVGETVQVYTDNNHIFTYRYRSSRETNPNDDSVFDYQGPPILTLQTCTGIWYQNRDLMTFDLVEVS